ncbi:hypothetical protein H2200_000956 [Cladophialophora chaetospira]|uniref:DUF7587 domain-containing protein n=1 Tax=Cladophialophora chaetospira TaxID=386627 RepID=A0AA38XPF8_9EURO|nr:hypothetical protein H2200_000956 [Cladophialophora chaetospira]
MGWASDEEGKGSNTTDFFNEQVDLAAYSVRVRAPDMFRVVPSYPVGHFRSGPEAAPKPERNNDLFARAPGLDYTWQTVRDHLTWQHVPSPFISFFTKFDMAMRWKNNFINEGAYRVYIFCYTTKFVPHLLDANELARELFLHTLENVGKRHYHEYLVLDRISVRPAGERGCLRDDLSITSKGDTEMQAQRKEMSPRITLTKVVSE